MWQKLSAWFRQGKMVRWIALGLIVGVASGFFAAGFFYLLEFTTHLSLDGLAGYEMPGPAGERIPFASSGHEFRRWVFFILPIVGGLLSGIIVYFFAPEAEGHGTDAMIEAFHSKGGKIRARVPFIKSIATIITLASGGSAGREGPIAQIGAGVGSILADIFGLTARDRRILLIAGTGAGLGAIFHAPLGGAITACEVIYREDLETDALIPTIIASITAYTIFSELFGFKAIFTIPVFTFDDPRQYIYYAILGFICVPLGLFYIRTFYFTRNRIFRPLPIPNFLKPMIGGLGVALIGLKFPQIYSAGWGQIQLALFGKLTLSIMAWIMIMKIFATNFTIGSGGSGGVFGPILFIGGMAGGVVGQIAHRNFPEIFTVTDVGAFVLVGMASFFAGVAHAPLGALLMVTEMTGGYQLIAPLLLVSTIAILFNRRWSIYENQVQNKFSSPAHSGEFTVNVLEEMRVEAVYTRVENLIPIPAGARFNEVMDHLAHDESALLPVARDDGTIIGIVSLDITRPIIFEPGMENLLIAEDLAVPAETIHPNDSLYLALQLFVTHPVHGLLVTDPKQPNHVLGILFHRDLIRAYSSEMIFRKGK